MKPIGFWASSLDNNFDLAVQWHQAKDNQHQSRTLYDWKTYKIVIEHQPCMDHNHHICWSIDYSIHTFHFFVKWGWFIKSWPNRNYKLKIVVMQFFHHFSRMRKNWGIPEKVNGPHPSLPQLQYANLVQNYQQEFFLNDIHAQKLKLLLVNDNVPYIGKNHKPIFRKDMVRQKFQTRLWRFMMDKPVKSR